MPYSGAIFSSAGFSFLPTGVHLCPSAFSKSTIAIGAGLISVVIKELSSEQQEHAGDDAATHSTPHLVKAFEHTTLLNSYKTVCDTVLAWNGGYGSHEKIVGGSSAKV